MQAAPVQEAPGQGEPDADPDTFNIYQLKGGDALHYHHFTGLDQLKKEGLKVEFENYEKVYSGPWTRGDKLEGIYERFNIDRPEDFTGHSLSVSDVVVLHRGGKDTSSTMPNRCRTPASWPPLWTSWPGRAMSRNTGS